MATLLIADDYAHILEVVCFALERAGHREIEAADGPGALAELAKQPIDLTVLKIVMPGREAFDERFHSEARRQARALPERSATDDGSRLGGAHERIDNALADGAREAIGEQSVTEKEAGRRVYPHQHHRWHDEGASHTQREATGLEGEDVRRGGA